MKTCRKCGTTKDVSEFWRDRAYPDGRKARCKDCMRVEKRAWKKANPERDREHWRRWRAKQPAGTLPYQRAWYERQPPAELRETRQTWKAAHRPRVNQLERERYARNREIERQRSRDWASRRRVQISDSGPDVVRAIAELVKKPCAYCGDTELIEIDHVIPLSRGGTHTVDNLAPACRFCNRSKGAKLLSEWKVAA